MDRERGVERQLRAIIFALLLLAVAAVAISRVPVTILSGTGSRPETHAVHDMLLVYLAVLFVPGIGVVAHPRWAAVAIWALWAFPVSLVALITRLGEPPRDHPHPDPSWPGTAIFWLMLAINAGIMIAVPLVRSRHRSPASPRSSWVPAARVHRS